MLLEFRKMKFKLHSNEKALREIKSLPMIVMFYPRLTIGTATQSLQGIL